MQFRGIWLGALVVFAACGGDADEQGANPNGSADGGTSSSSGGSGSTSSSGGSGSTSSGGSGADAGDGGRGEVPAQVPTRVVVGHLGGDDFLVHQFTLDPLQAQSGSPYDATTAYNGFAGSSSEGVLALPLPGRKEVAVVDRATLTPIAGSPYSIANTPLTPAFDPGSRRLYVYAADGAQARKFYVFDTSATPFTELPESPLSTELIGAKIQVDLQTGHLFGYSATTFWAAEHVDGAIRPLFGTPLTGSSFSDVAVDSKNRRVYYLTRIPSQLHARDLDTFAEVAGSPLALPGEFPTNLALDGHGGLFVLDGRAMESADPTTLHYVTTEPLALQPTCGAPAGCTIAATETGLAIDPESRRLFVTADRGTQPGELKVWDISTPTTPVEVSSLPVGPVPAWVHVY